MSHSTNVRQFIIDQFVPETHSDEIPDDLNLIDNGIIDSLGVLKLVAYIEDSFDIALDPTEIDPVNLSSIKSINELIASKRM